MSRFLFAGVSALALCSAATAADLPLPVEAMPAPMMQEHQAFNWTGFYLGLHGGYGFGEADAEFGSGAAGATDLDPEGPFVGGQIGLNWQFGSGLVIGAEGDASYAKIEDEATVIGAGPAVVTTNDQEFDVLASARGRLGFAFDNVLPFVTGGVAWAHGERTQSSAIVAGASDDNWHFGWTAGAGVEYGINSHWSAKLEYRYTDLEEENYDVPAPGGAGTDVDLQMHSAQFGVNYRF